MIEFLKELKSIFYIVRLVDVNTNTEYFVMDDGKLEAKPTKCFEVWGKNSRCNNCISSMVYKSKKQSEKFEFIGNEVFYVIAKYIEHDNKPYVLELVNKVDNKSFMSSIDRHLFVKQIENFNNKLYVDPLTHAFNRLYYEEQIKHLDISAVALFDIDKFKAINDTYGHLCGDEALHEVCKIVLDNIRSTDTLIRYGGDEFLIVFNGISKSSLKEKLDLLRKKIETIKLENYPDTKISISIGGIMSNNIDEETLKKLDDRLYKAKIKRNNTVLDD